MQMIMERSLSLYENLSEALLIHEMTKSYNVLCPPSAYTYLVTNFILVHTRYIVPINHSNKTSDKLTMQ